MKILTESDIARLKSKGYKVDATPDIRYIGKKSDKKTRATKPSTPKKTNADKIVDILDLNNQDQKNTINLLEKLLNAIQSINFSPTIQSKQDPQKITITPIRNDKGLVTEYIIDKQ